METKTCQQLPAGKDVKWLLLRRFLYGDGFDEPHEKQQDIVNEQKSRPVVDDPAQEEEEWPMKYPIAPQHCRRWGKPETYVVFKISWEKFDGLRG